MSARRRRVLLVSALDAPVIEEDAGILSAHFDVKRAAGKGMMALLRALVNVAPADVVCSWFLSVYGAASGILAGLLGKRVVIILGGVDVAREPELGYGLWNSRWKSVLARQAIRTADLVLVVAESLRGDAVRLAAYDGSNIRYLPTGYDASRWTPPEGPREQSVLCVAWASEPARMAVKGVDVLVEAARLAPGIPFVVIGVEPRLAGDLGAPPNVTFLPSMPRESLLPYYRRAKVYCQPSRREGLPNALCEAMLCGCIPVATDAGASPLAVGGTGFVVSPDDPGSLAEALTSALAEPESRGAEARRRIVELFPLERRKAELPVLVGAA